MSSIVSRRNGVLTLLAMTLLAPAMVFASEPTGPLSAEPTVPRPGTKPCVVTVYTDAELIANDSMPFEPPAGCSGPWSKVVLEADMTSLIRTNSVGNLRISLSDNITHGEWILYMGAPQINAGAPSWRVERDLTDYSALFRSPGEWAIDLNPDWDNGSPSHDEDSVHGEVRLLFYPQSAAFPAPRVPDGVYAQDVSQVLPRNIVKAYVEVLAQGLDETDINGSSDRFWYSCMPNAAIATYPALLNQFALGDAWGASLTSSPEGCNGGSFREVEVWLDENTFLGIAPLYPWLPSNVHPDFRNTLDTPVPGAQGLNFIPYRLDVTPFASKLDDGASHRLSVRVVGDNGPIPVHVRAEGKLLVFRDPKSNIVHGAVTRNTLAHATPAVSPAFTAASDILMGTVRTQDSRKMDVVGFVDTSAGRVYSAVHTEVYFDNRQSVRVDGLVFPNYRSYITVIGLDSRVLQSTASVLAGTVTERNATSVQYPLRVVYGMRGEILDPLGEGYVAFPSAATANADLVRFQYTDQWRGPGHYIDAVRDHFTGRRTHVFGIGPGIDSDWSSQRDVVFVDTLAGCYTAARLTTAGSLTGSATGIGCAGGVNNNAWFTRPDGSPENLGWAP